jgi:hypothetical protein
MVIGGKTILDHFGSAPLYFGLPMINYTLRSLLPGYHQADMDVGEIVLNFILGEEVRPYSGVYVSRVRLSEEDVKQANGVPDWWTCKENPQRKWERWCRNWMGLRDSPYRSLQMLLIAKVKTTFFTGRRWF